jgi:hypothetical protein
MQSVTGRSSDGVHDVTFHDAIRADPYIGGGASAAAVSDNQPPAQGAGPHVIASTTSRSARPTQRVSDHHIAHQRAVLPLRPMHTGVDPTVDHHGGQFSPSPCRLPRPLLLENDGKFFAFVCNSQLKLEPWLVAQRIHHPFGQRPSYGDVAF